VPAAKVIIRNTNRGVENSTATDANGIYKFTFRDFLGSGMASGDTIEVNIQKDGIDIEIVNHQITSEEFNKSSIVIEEIKLLDRTTSH
jgi:hypothetical protein